MCGLVGLINKRPNGFTRDQQEVFSSLLFIDMLRGNDSTGVICVHDSGDVYLAKEASDPVSFMKTKEYDEVMKRSWSNGNALIGHNRKATRGIVNDENAHPFVVDDKIVLVHNGTMYGDHKKIADVEVDSHAIAHLIHEKGDVTKALNELNAAYALIWYDFEKKTVNMVRNNQRPLFWVETNDSWIWASEKAMLDFVIQRYKLNVTEGPGELGEHILQTFTLKNRQWDCSNEVLKIEKPPVVYQHNYSHGPYMGESGNAVTYRARQAALEEALQHAGPWDDEAMAWEHYTKLNPHMIRQRQQREGWLNRPQQQGGPAAGVTFPGGRTTGLVETVPVRENANTTSQFQRTLAERENKLMPYAEFQYTEKYYPPGSRVLCTAFDYCYANQRDSVGGFYLYSSPLDDQSILVRHFWDAGVVTEERILQMASTQYVFEFIVGQRDWHALNPNVVNPQPTTPGYFVILTTGTPKIIQGGGVTNNTAVETTKRSVH